MFFVINIYKAPTNSKEQESTQVSEHTIPNVVEDGDSSDSSVGRVFKLFVFYFL